MKYQEMMAFMAKAKNISKGRPTGQRGTRIHLHAPVPDDCFPTIVQLRYHDTALINWYPGGRVTFCNRGWNTRTTIARMNEYLRHFGYRIMTRKGTKHLRKIDAETLSWSDTALDPIFSIHFIGGKLYTL